MNTTANHKKIIEILNKNSFNFYTYTRKDEKAQTWLLKEPSLRRSSPARTQDTRK